MPDVAGHARNRAGGRARRYDPRVPGKGDVGVVVGVAVVVVLALLGVALTRTTPSGPAVARAGLPAPAAFCGNVPSVLGGQSQVADAGPAGVYIWNDFQNFHVRAKGSAVTIRLTGSAPIGVKQAPAAGIEQATYGASFAAWDAAKARGASATVSGNSLTIRIPASTAALGPNIEVGCGVKSLQLQVDGPGGPLPITDVHLGASGQAPANPFRIERDAS
ncbi:MAG: hypothetical protein JWN46_3890 [Acidimicrobiales bacterium]|nr:hypothetical protein [Acidimicrobiales bacterium]